MRNFQAADQSQGHEDGRSRFFYHSGEGKEIVGIAEVAKTAYPDPTDKDGKSVTVDFKAVEPVKKKVTLAEIKADPKFKELKLVRQSRLSVVAGQRRALEAPAEDGQRQVTQWSTTPAASSRCRRRSWSSSSTMR